VAPKTCWIALLHLTLDVLHSSFHIIYTSCFIVNFASTSHLTFPTLLTFVSIAFTIPIHHHHLYITVSHFGEHKRLHLESSEQNYYIISFTSKNKSNLHSSRCRPWRARFAIGNSGRDTRPNWSKHVNARRLRSRSHSSCFVSWRRWGRWRRGLRQFVDLFAGAQREGHWRIATWCVWSIRGARLGC